MSKKQPRYYFSKLPCKPYIKKYIRSYYGEPVPANNKTTLGCYVNACLAKERYTEHLYSKSFVHRDFTDTLVFQISGWAFINIGFDFPTAKVIELNKFLEARFEEHMYMYVQANFIPGRTERRRLIETFAEMHGIILGFESDDDISLDALVKTERRMRAAIDRERGKVSHQPETKTQLQLATTN